MRVQTLFHQHSPTALAMSTPESQNKQAPGYPNVPSEGRFSVGLNQAGDVSADQARAVLKTIPVGFAGGVVPAAMFTVTVLE